MLARFLPARLDLAASCVRQAGAHRTAVVLVWDTFHQAVFFEVVDEAGDVSRGRVEVCGEVTQRCRPAPVEAKQDAHTALAEAALLGPALLEVVHHLAGDPNGRQ